MDDKQTRLFRLALFAVVLFVIQGYVYPDSEIKTRLMCSAVATIAFMLLETFMPRMAVPKDMAKPKPLYSQ